MPCGQEAPKQIDTEHYLVINRVCFMNEYHKYFGYVRVLEKLKTRYLVQINN